MKIRPKQLPYNTLPLFAFVRDSELRHPPSTAAKKLARQYGLSPSLAEAIVRANGFGPIDRR